VRRKSEVKTEEMKRRQTKDGTLRISFRSDKHLDSGFAEGMVALVPVVDGR